MKCPLFAGPVVALVCLAAAAATAQNLSTDEINTLIDERLEDLNPYQEILDDPDPDRALAGMQIMLQQGDETLRDMALQYGLLSPNPGVRQMALESHLDANPEITIKFDGTKVQDSGYEERVEDSWSGTVDQAETGYWRVPIRGYSEEAKCYTDDRYGGCFFTLNPDGVFITLANDFNERATLTAEGTLVGMADIGLSEPVPFSIRLLP